MRKVRITGIGAGLLVAAALVKSATAAQQAQPTARPPFTIETLKAPSEGDSASPQITVSGGKTLLSWLERSGEKTALKFSERTPAGWSAPVVVMASEHLIANFADVPSVRALADGSLVAHWIEMNGPDPEAYDLKLSTSRDGGKTWSAPASPHKDGTKTQHGFASFFNVGSSLGLVWLDGRQTSGGKGDMTLRAATSIPLKNDKSDMLVASRVCDCCPTAAASTADGPIVAYRGRTADEIRDIYVTRLDRTAWSAPVLVHNDGWKINGCPVNGPAIAARGKDVAVAWFTMQAGQGRAFLAFSSDAGRTFGAPVRVDDAGSSGRVQVELLADGSAAVSWIELGKGPSQLRVRTVSPAGVRSRPADIALGLGTQFPRMGAAKGELVFAWTENSRGITRIYTARAKL
jgi:hypothetical protein